MDSEIIKQYLIDNHFYCSIRQLSWIAEHTQKVNASTWEMETNAS